VERAGEPSSSDAGLGADADYIFGLGFDTIAFDVSDTAVRLARERFPGSGVHYLAADPLDPPQEWLRAVDLVVEVITVQALPDPPRRQAIVNVGRLVAPGGTLTVIAAVHDERDAPAQGPPWPLTRPEIEAFATDGLTPVRIENVAAAAQPSQRRWHAESRRSRRG
jgi:SAM-dependent methyltransferase